MRRGSAICSASRVGAFIALAPADGDDDLERVTLGEACRGVAAARHDLAVSFDGHALSRELERVEELRDICPRLETPHLAVDRELDALENPGATGEKYLNT